MGAPRNARFAVAFGEWFPEGLYLVGEVAPVTEYQSQEDRARNRPARPRIDEATGLLVFRGMFMDPSAAKDREKSFPVEFTAKVQPVPPEAIPGTVIRPVELDGMTVQPRAEASSQAKWLTWTVRATGMLAPGGAAHGNSTPSHRSAASKSASGGEPAKAA